MWLGARRRTELAALVGIALGVTAGCGERALSKRDGGAEAGATSDAGGIGDAGGIIGAGGIGGVGGAPSAGFHDTCSSDADCPPIACASSPCDEAICARGDDGFHHCTSRTHPPIPACDPEYPSCCASDTDCPGGQACLSILTSPRVGSCGGIPSSDNYCTADQCHADADCAMRPNGACTAGYPRACGYGPCRTNSDCTAGPGGVCDVALVDIIDGCWFPIVFCRYSNDPCRTSADCPKTQACAPDGSLAGPTCVDRLPPPP